MNLSGSNLHLLPDLEQMECFFLSCGLIRIPLVTKTFAELVSDRRDREVSLGMTD